MLIMSFSLHMTKVHTRWFIIQEIVYLEFYLLKWQLIHIHTTYTPTDVKYVSDMKYVLMS